MAMIFSKVVTIKPSVGESTTLERIYTDPGVLANSIMIFYNGAAINTYISTVDPKTIIEKYYATYAVTSTQVSIKVFAKQGFKSPKYNPASPAINLNLTPLDDITVTYQYTI